MSAHLEARDAEAAAGETAVAHAERMDAIYRTQRHIYDVTRKYYLLGRDRLIDDLAAPDGARILELGCGTGRNLALIARRYPRTRLFGLDISAEMLGSAERAAARIRQTTPVTLRRGDASRFAAGDFGEDGFDRIVIPYALSMIPPWEATIEAALAALNPGGSLHIVDFGQQERLPAWFRAGLHAWLARFHVTPRGSLRAVLEGRAAANGRTLTMVPLYRGYAWYAVVA